MIYTEGSPLSPVPLMELDLPDPAGREEVQAVAKRARRLNRMAELIPTLRIGAEQDKFVELSEKN